MKVFNRKYNEINNVVAGKGIEPLTYRLLSDSNEINSLARGWGY
jgi:hypothetical protein